MFDKQPSRRKARVPMSREELYYFKKIKELNQVQKIEQFKSTVFFKITNRINIALAAFLTYCLLSVFILTHWDKAYLVSVDIGLGETNVVNHKRTVAELHFTTTNGEDVLIKTNDLYDPPKINDLVFLGRDFLFNKILKVKLLYDDRTFWTVNSYASLTVCCFVLLFGCFIYNVNKHLTINGLLMVLGLFLLASCYFIFI